MAVICDLGSARRVHNQVSVALPKRQVSTILARANQPQPCGEALRRIVVVRYCGADGTDAGLLNYPIEDRSRCLSGVSLPPSVLDQTPSNLHVTIGARWPLQVDRSHDSVGTPFDDDTDSPRKLVAIRNALRCHDKSAPSFGSSGRNVKPVRSETRSKSPAMSGSMSSGTSATRSKRSVSMLGALCIVIVANRRTIPRFRSLEKNSIIP